MLEIIKKIKIILNKFKIKKWSERKYSNKNNIIKKEIRNILNLLSG